MKGILDNINILIIDDNHDETNLIAKVIDINRQNIDFNSVKDDIEAMDYLHKKGKYNNCLTPSLIMLDLNLPKKNGFEVLKEIKSDNILKCIPVIILTNSKDDIDIIKSYALHANAYISKPTDFDEFESYISIFKEFWFNDVQLPNVDYPI